MDKIDPRYQRGKIYTVRCYDDDKLIYVGSTIQPLSVRMARHRCHKNCSLYKYVNGYWDNWYIELYEEYPCNNKQLLEKREGEITRLIGNINKKISGRTQKEWIEANKEYLEEYRKQYKKTNKQKIKQYNKKWSEDNKEQKSEKAKEYYKSNKEIIKCNLCGCEVVKSYLKRHQNTKKCLKSQKDDI